MVISSSYELQNVILTMFLRSSVLENDRKDLVSALFSPTPREMEILQKNITFYSVQENNRKSFDPWGTPQKPVYLHGKAEQTNTHEKHTKNEKFMKWAIIPQRCVFYLTKPLLTLDMRIRKNGACSNISSLEKKCFLSVVSLGDL